MLQGLLRPRPGISQSLPPHPIGQSKSHMGHPDSRGGETMGHVAHVTEGEASWAFWQASFYLRPCLDSRPLSPDRLLRDKGWKS